MISLIAQWVEALLWVAVKGLVWEVEVQQLRTRTGLLAARLAWGLEPAFKELRSEAELKRSRSYLAVKHRSPSFDCSKPLWPSATAVERGLPGCARFGPRAAATAASVHIAEDCCTD